jgi:hypothetical protein
MTAPSGAPLPEIDDRELAARLAPLVQAVVPAERVGAIGKPDSRTSGIPAEPTAANGSEGRTSERPVSRQTGRPGGASESGSPADRTSGYYPGLRSEGPPAVRQSDNPEDRQSDIPEDRPSGASTSVGSPAQRAVKRGVEFLLPDRVVLALKADAAQRGVSASVRLLEILRDAGYPVFPEDFLDLRKLPRRG